MSETNTKFSKEQIKAYGEMHNLFPLNVDAMIANIMRLEGMIQELQAELSLITRKNTIFAWQDVFGNKIQWQSGLYSQSTDTTL